MTFTDPTLNGVPVKKIHLTELRTAVMDARWYAGMSFFNFTDSNTIKATHINELRSALK